MSNNKLFTPYKLGPVTLRNRIVRSAAFEYKTESTIPKNASIEKPSILPTILTSVPCHSFVYGAIDKAVQALAPALCVCFDRVLIAFV